MLPTVTREKDSHLQYTDLITTDIVQHIDYVNQLIKRKLAFVVF